MIDKKTGWLPWLLLAVLLLVGLVMDSQAMLHALASRLWEN